MARARSDAQLNLPPTEVQRLASEGESASPKSGPTIPDMSLEKAKAQFGRAFRRTIAGSALKEFGDPSYVNRVGDGEIPGPIARAWQRNPGGFVKALAEESGLFDVRVTIDERKDRKVS